MTLLDHLRREQIRTAHAVAARLAENLAVPPARECGDDRSPSNPRANILGLRPHVATPKCSLSMCGSGRGLGQGATWW